MYGSHTRTKRTKNQEQKEKKKMKFQKNKFILRLGNSSHFLFVFSEVICLVDLSLFIILFVFLFVIPEGSTGTVL